MKTKIGVIEGYTGAVLQTMGKVVQELNAQGYDIEVQARYQASGIGEEFWQWLKKDADVIFLYVNTGDESFDMIQEVVSSVNVPVFSMAGDLSNVPLNALAIAKQYHIYGGFENTKYLLLFMAQYCGKIKAEVPPPKKMPWHGIYHPDAGHLFESQDDFMKWYKEKGTHTVGLLLYRNSWLEGDTAIYDAVIKEFERKGVNVLPVISSGFGNKDFGIENNDIVLNRYFIVDGKTIIDLLVNLQVFFLVPRAIEGWDSPSKDGIEILKKLNVPVIQAVRSHYQTLEEWRKSKEGLDPMGILTSVAMPEFDGVIEPTLIGAAEKTTETTVGGVYPKHIPVQEQIEFLVERSLKWTHLKDVPTSDRKVAFILHNPPCKGAEATVGAGSGLDTLESVARIFQRLEKEGYYLGDWLPENGKELIDIIIERKAINEFRWTPLSEIVKKGGAAAMLNRDKYLEWFRDFPVSVQKEIIETWGDPASDFSKIKNNNPNGLSEETEWAKLSMGLYEGKIVIPGIQFGNVFLGVQPKRGCAGARCDGEVCKILHDPTCPPPHQWLAVYKWIEKEFKADVIVHVGKHGYLEFLPGKSVGLSNECYPQLSIGSMPHLYIYIVNDPMEGTIAKRRGYATLIDHLIPVMAPSGLYEGLEELSELLAEYNKAKSMNDKARLHSLLHLTEEKAKEVNLFKEFKVEEGFIDYLHGQLTLLRETQIRDGLHILGKAPRGKELANLLVSILRFDVGKHPSIRRCILECMGLDYDEIVENPVVLNNEFGNTNGELLDESTTMAVKIMDLLLSDVETGVFISDEEILLTCKEAIGCDFKKDSEELVNAVKFGLSLIPKIVHGVDDEIANLIRGFNSEHIEAGASGVLTRGKIDVLPTGRNFYSIDPMKVPTKAAWRIGIKLAEALLEGYLCEERKYPENIGFVLFSSDILRADGEEVSQILYTMGARPVWSENGTVRSVDVIPLNVLNRPRIDCTVRISGIVRDACPNIMELIDEAAQKIAALDELVEMNYVKKHTMETMERLLEQDDYDEKRAKRKATYRVFGSKPGTYGTGVNLAVFASAWKEDKDLGDVFIDWSGYAYGKEVLGEASHAEFADLLKNVEITYRAHESDEFDIFDCCCYFGYQGGFTIAAKGISGKDVKVYHGDTRDTDRPAIRDMKEEIERVVRTRLLNPKWIEGKKRHGYKGAGDISKRVDHVYGWSATTKLVANWIYDEITRTFVTDEKMREWFKENNPYALEEMTRRLIEAAERELWKPEEEMLKKLKESYLDLEGLMEEKLGIIEGEYQGGEITVLAREDVEAWDAKVKGVEKEWKEVVSLKKGGEEVK